MKIYIARHSFSDEPLHTNALISTALRLRELGVSFSLAAPFYDSHINRGRNRVAERFLATDCTHLLNIDADVVFTPWDVERLVSEARLGADFVGAPYPMKRPDGAYVVGTLREPWHRTESGFYEAQDIGAGFSMLSRRVFDTLAAVPGAPTAVSDVVGEATEGKRYHVFYDSGLDGDQYLTEDWWIARAWQCTGGKCWLDGDAKLVHIGKYGFTARSSLHEAVEWHRLQRRPPVEGESFLQVKAGQ